MKNARAGREQVIDAFIAQSCILQCLEEDGRNLGREVRQRQQAEAVRASLPRQIVALDESLRYNLATSGPRAAEDSLRTLRVNAEMARRRLAGITVPITTPVRTRSSPSIGGP